MNKTKRQASLSPSPNQDVLFHSSTNARLHIVALSKIGTAFLLIGSIISQSVIVYACRSGMPFLVSLTQGENTRQQMEIESNRNSFQAKLHIPPLLFTSKKALHYPTP